MIDIKTYINRTTMIKESYIVVDDMEVAENMARRVSCGENMNLKFTTYSIKNRFMQEISIQRPDIIFVNCNSSSDKFFESIGNNTVVFNNVERCTDCDILEFIKNTKGTFIC